jgi:hypothetical protein
MTRGGAAMKRTSASVLMAALVVSCGLTSTISISPENSAPPSGTEQASTPPLGIEPTPSPGQPGSLPTPVVTSAPLPSPGCDAVALPALGPKQADAPSWGGSAFAPPVYIGYQWSLADVRASGFDAMVPTEVPVPMQVVMTNTKTGQITEMRAYFAADTPTEDTTLWELIEDGGMLFSQRHTIGNDAARVRRAVKGRAKIVQIGPHDAALIWGSPFFQGGRRPYGVYWSDGTFDFSLIAGLETPEQTVAVARSTYC